MIACSECSMKSSHGHDGSGTCLLRGLREGGYLIIDDTSWARWAQQSEAVSWVWSSAHGRVLRGHQVVLLVWTDGVVRVPLGMRLWKKGGASKVELAQQLLREVERRGMRPEYVLFDSWYAAASLLHLLEDFGSI